MSETLEKLIKNLTPEKRDVLARLLEPPRDPIAIVGMSCRFPGGSDSPEAYWKMLLGGVDAISEVPPERWNIDEYYDPDPAAPGKMATRYSGFLNNVDQFDAQFFGITPREATRMDPQQRLMLEVGWEAFEHAGIGIETLMGSDTGVFVGMTSSDYHWLQVSDLSDFDGHSGLGGAHSIATGRLAFQWDLRGPAFAVDTACSSSLVATHLACTSLRRKECDMALVGGVNLILSPAITISLSKWGMLAPDGRCKAFDSRADGFVRSEGCGFVVLKRLSDALADRDHVIALIRGTAINQDGRSTSMTAPSGLAQQAVLRQALETAGVHPSKVSFIETHGTGTELGDPLEIEALQAVIGQPRPDGPGCAIGSVKANVGHMEAAAGIGGLIKTALCLQHGVIPPQLHLNELNPHIALENTPFFIPTKPTPWPDGADRRYAGVSSFGLSGTNAHAVLEQAPEPVAAGRSPALKSGQAYLLPLSARTPQALQATTRVYLDMFANGKANGLELNDACYTASRRRSHHPYRMTLVAATREELADRLEALAEGKSKPVPPVRGNGPGLTFVFSGQGSQWIGMGRSLLEQDPVFRRTVQHCDELLRPLAGWSLIDELSADESRSRLGQTEVAQPAIFAVQVGLAALLRSWGILPEAILGHSSGEVAAAHVAGVLSLEDAVRVIHHRGRLMQRATGQGRMAAVGLSEEEVRKALAGYESRLWIASMNGPTSTVISGEHAALKKVLDSLREREVFCRDLGVDYAFHTPQMESFLGELMTCLKGIEPRPASTRIISTVTAETSGQNDFDAAYWARNVREPVRFAAAIDRLVEEGHDTFLEIGPHQVLATPIKQCLEHRDRDGKVFASLRRGRDERASLLRSAGALYTIGYPIDWSGLYPDGELVRLPFYPWQYKRYWLQNGSATPSAPSPASDADADHSRRRENVAGFYDSVSDVRDPVNDEVYVTFAPFAERDSEFSWLLTAYEPKKHPGQAQRMLNAQKELRRVLFRGIDFSSIGRALDFGCGFGTDVIALSGEHAHLRCDGFTISSKQAEIANRAIRERGLQDRVAVYNRDSAKDEFPGQYDLVFGFEVAHYIKNKRDLFANIDRHLSDGGLLVLADFVANTVSEIGHDETSSYIVTADQWNDLLTQYKLRVVEYVDVSREVSNFLDDPDAERNLVRLGEGLGDAGPIRSHFKSYNGLGQLFGKGLASYALITVQKDRCMRKDEIARINRERLASPTPYAEVLARDPSLRAEPAAATLPTRDDWLYEVRWMQRSRRKTGSPAEALGQPGSWVILTDGQGVGDALARRLEAAAQICVMVRPGDDFSSADPRHFTIDAANPDDVRKLLATALGSDTPTLRGVVHLWNLDAVSPEEATGESMQSELAQGCGSLLHLVQGLAADRGAEARLWLVTRGAQAVDETRPVTVSAAAQWGLGKTIALEQPSLWGGMVDLDPEAAAADAAGRLLEEIVDPDGEDHLAMRRDNRYVARLSQATGLGESASIAWRADGTYLITGGLGGLGLETARWMVEHGARHLVLTQRSALPDRSTWSEVADTRVAEQIAAIRSLEAAGASVRVIAADIAESDQVAKLLAEVRASMPPLKGVVHTAGILDDGILSQLDLKRFEKVMAPKVRGAWNLHRLTAEDSLDCFVLFSSAASVLGSPGQANYCAANAALDALAHHRRAQGLPGLSINWGPWAEVGMAAAQADRGQRVAQRGIESIAPGQGVALFGRLLGQDRAQMSVLPIDFPRWREFYPEAAAAPLLAELVYGPGEPAQPAVAEEKPAEKPVQKPAAAAPPSRPEPAKGATSLKQSLMAATPEERLGRIESYIREEVVKAIEYPELDVSAPLNSVGIDSLMAVELRNRFQADLGVDIPVVTFLEGASVSELAAEVSKQMSGRPKAEKIARMLKKLGQLSPEEAKKLLDEKKRLAEQ